MRLPRTNVRGSFTIGTVYLPDTDGEIQSVRPFAP